MVRYSLILLLVSTLQACCTNTFSKSYDKQLLTQPLDFTYLNISSYINYQAGKQRCQLRVKFRIQKNQVIWFSVLGPYGIEVARGILTPTKVQWINRVQRVYQVCDYPTLQAQLHCPFSYDVAQAILLGEIPFPYKAPASLAQGRGFKMVQQQVGRWRLTATIDQSTQRLSKVSIMDIDTQAQCTGYYKHWQKYQRCALFRNAQIDLGKNTIHIVHASVHCTQKPLNFPFTIPPQYEKM